MSTQTGIWLDLRQAYIIHLPDLTDFNAPVEVVHLSSSIEERSPTGGSRSKTPWGPQGGDMQRSAQERQHQEEKQYFREIIDMIAPYTTQLVVFGPSTAKLGLVKAINEHEQYRPELLGIVNADQMTEHQMIAWVRDFFHRPAPRRLPKRL